MPTHNEYMNAYLQKRYAENPVRAKQYKNSLNIRKKYDIDEETWKRYGYCLHSVISVCELLKNLPDDMAEHILENRGNLTFNRKE